MVGDDDNTPVLPETGAPQGLVAVALLIRAAFVQQYRRAQELHSGIPSDWGARPMPAWDGGISGGGRRSQNVWLKAAQRCVDEQLDPLDLVAAAFSLPPQRGGEPLRPNVLLGKDVIAAYYQAQQDHVLKAMSEWAQQEQTLEHYAHWLTTPEAGAEGLRLGRRATLTDRTRRSGPAPTASSPPSPLLARGSRTGDR